MILEEATFEAFSYYPSELKLKSSKPIIATCDLCGKFRILSKNLYRTLCLSCVEKGNTKSLGFKHTEKTKAKMSLMKRSENLSEKTRAFIRASRKGLTHTLGKHHTKEAKALLSAAKKGDENSNWCGGISFEPYCTKFDEGYKQLIRTKFNNKCFWCDMSTEENGTALSVHYVDYNKNCGCDETKCICVPLCKSCHSKTNTDRNEWQEKIMMKLELLGRLK